MSEPLMRFENVHYAYPDGTRALDGVSFDVAPGRKTVVLGRNGCGKSTLFLLADGLLRPDKGTVYFRGAPLDYSPRGVAAVRAQVGLIFQETESQLFSASVEQDVSFGPYNLGWDEATVVEATRDAVARTGCGPFQHKPVHHLSGGQKKRAAVAGVAAMKPGIIYADEPLAHLDSEGADGMVDLFSRLHQQGITFVVATHNLAFAKGWFDDAVIMGEGRVVAAGPAASILSDGAILREAGLVSRHFGLY